MKDSTPKLPLFIKTVISLIYLSFFAYSVLQYLQIDGNLGYSTVQDKISIRYYVDYNPEFWIAGVSTGLLAGWALSMWILRRLENAVYDRAVFGVFVWEIRIKKERKNLAFLFHLPSMILLASLLLFPIFWFYETLGLMDFATIAKSALFALPALPILYILERNILVVVINTLKKKVLGSRGEVKSRALPKEEGF